MHCNPLYLNMTLVVTTPSNLIFSATIRSGITSLLDQNLTASADIWTIYKRFTSGHAISTLAFNSQMPISFDAQVIYTNASYHLGFSFGNAIFFFCQRFFRIYRSVIFYVEL